MPLWSLSDQQRDQLQRQSIKQSGEWNYFLIHLFYVDSSSGNSLQIVCSTKKLPDFVLILRLSSFLDWILGATGLVE